MSSVQKPKKKIGSQARSFEDLIILLDQLLLSLQVWRRFIMRLKLEKVKTAAGLAGFYSCCVDNCGVRRRSDFIEFWGVRAELFYRQGRERWDRVLSDPSIWVRGFRKKKSIRQWLRLVGFLADDITPRSAWKMVLRYWAVVAPNAPVSPFFVWQTADSAYQQEVDGKSKASSSCYFGDAQLDGFFLAVIELTMAAGIR